MNMIDVVVHGQRRRIYTEKNGKGRRCFLDWQNCLNSCSYFAPGQVEDYADLHTLLQLFLVPISLFFKPSWCKQLARPGTEAILSPKKQRRPLLGILYKSSFFYGWGYSFFPFSLPKVYCQTSFFWEVVRGGHFMFTTALLPNTPATCPACRGACFAGLAGCHVPFFSCFLRSRVLTAAAPYPRTHDHRGASQQ